LHRGQQAEPVALAGTGEAEQAHVVLADLEIGEHGDLVAGEAERGQSLARAVDEIADALDVDHRPVRPRLVEPPGQLGNHDAVLPSRDGFAKGHSPGTHRRGRRMVPMFAVTMGLGSRKRRADGLGEDVHRLMLWSMADWNKVGKW